MLLDVRNALKNPGQSYPLSAELSLPDVEVLDERLAFDQVRLDGEFVGSGESVKITGKVSALVYAHCALCLEPVTETIETDVDEVFTKDNEPDDPDRYPLDGYEIELGALVQDALLLALPMRFLCADDCRGLCPVCGTNQNTQRCTCQEGLGIDRPFSALSGLLTKDEEV